MSNEKELLKMKKDRLRSKVGWLISGANKGMFESLDKALNSGAVDIEGWDEENTPMILPKSIIIALLENEATQYSPKGTSYERQVRKEANNIKLFI